MWHIRQLKLIFLLLLIFHSSSCKNTTSSKPESISPFVLSKLNLSKKDNFGNTEWKVRSPEARYQLGKRLIRAITFEGTIFSNSEPAFNLRAKSANVINDGEIILLEGNVQLHKLNGNRLKVTGDRVIWNTKDSTIVIDQNPIAFDHELQLTTQKAVFNHMENKLSFIGNTRISSKTKKSSKNDKSIFTVSIKNGSWNFKTGKFSANGPVEGVRLILSNQSYQKIKGSSVYGNSNFGFIGLNNCIVYQDNESIKSNKCQWGWKDEVIRFTGKVKMIRGINVNPIFKDNVNTPIDNDGLLEIN